MTCNKFNITIQSKPTRKDFIDIEGLRFNRLTVKKFIGKRGTTLFWECLCECGNTTIVDGRSLRRNMTKSCGCLKIEKAISDKLTHGKSFSCEYWIWNQMRERCQNPKHKGFQWYGGRGIKVCERWQHSFEHFFADMGERPSKKHSIDRVDNDLGYSPENCKWVTTMQQARNKRNNAWLTFNHKTLCVTDWAKEVNISVSAIADRLRRGWTVEQALSIPSLTKHQRLKTV